MSIFSNIGAALSREYASMLAKSGKIVNKKVTGFDNKNSPAGVTAEE